MNTPLTAAARDGRHRSRHARLLVRDAAAAACLAGLALVPRPGIGVALAVLVVAVVVGTGSGGVRRGVMALAVVVLLQSIAIVVARTGGPASLSLAELPFALARAGAPWLVAVAWTQRAHVRRSARIVAAQQEQQREAAAERARQDGRVALAEGLHDDLGHALSLVAVNLGALEVRGDLAPDVVAQVRTAREQLGTAVERLGASVSSLRAGGDHRRSTAGSVEAVLHEARRSGMSVTVERVGVGRMSGGALAARVVQETLTNAAKHAPGEPVRILVEREDDGMQLVISNASPAGRPVRCGPHGGTGLRALSREAEQHGGEVSWSEEDCATGQFVVRARLRGDDTAPRPEPSGGGDDLSPAFDIATAAHRRGALVLLSAAVTIVLALATIELAVRGLA